MLNKKTVLLPSAFSISSLHKGWGIDSKKQTGDFSLQKLNDFRKNIITRYWHLRVLNEKAIRLRYHSTLLPHAELPILQFLILTYEWSGYGDQTFKESLHQEKQTNTNRKKRVQKKMQGKKFPKDKTPIIQYLQRKWKSCYIYEAKMRRKNSQRLRTFDKQKY